MCLLYHMTQMRGGKKKTKQKNKANYTLCNRSVFVWPRPPYRCRCNPINGQLWLIKHVWLSADLHEEPLILISGGDEGEILPSLSGDEPSGRVRNTKWGSRCVNYSSSYLCTCTLTESESRTGGSHMELTWSDCLILELNKMYGIVIHL